jgi:hypothetical protein
VIHEDQILRPLRCRAGVALAAAVLSLGAVLASASIGQARSHHRFPPCYYEHDCGLPPYPLVPFTGRVSVYEWTAMRGVAVSLMRDFNLWYAKLQEGAAAVCTDIVSNGEQSTRAGALYGRDMKAVGKQLHVLGTRGSDELKSWGRRLKTRAKAYRSRVARARVRDASGKIVDGAGQMESGMTALGDAYDQLAGWSCHPAGVLGAQERFSTGDATVEKGFAEIPLRGRLSH